MKHSAAKRFISITLVALMVAMLGACGQPAAPAAPAPAPAPAAPAPAPAAPAPAPAAPAADKGVRVYQLKVEIDAPFKEYAKLYTEKTGVPVTIESVGGGADTQGMLKGYAQAGNMPDIFVFEGPGQYETWKEYMADLSGEEWVDDTAAEFVVDGKVYGFPMAVEGYGMGYNADLLAKAGIDPATLTTVDAYKAAFKKLDGMKKELGIDSVVSLGVSKSGGLDWVSGNHNFGVYLSAGLKNGDTSIINDVLAGKVDEARMKEYAEYVKLLMDYSNKDILLTGNYDQQVAAFADQKAVFIHQGNWIDPNLAPLNLTFKMAYAPHAFSKNTIDGIQVGAPSWLAVNAKGNVEEAKAFLASIATTPEGHDFMVNKAKMVAAYGSVTLKPTTPLSISVMEWVSKGKTYDWEQFKMPDGFGQNVLAPIYELLGQGTITTEEFAKQITAAIATIPTLKK